MRKIIVLFIAATVVASIKVEAGIAFAPPPGGWAYLYTGDAGGGAPRRQNQFALDGTWRHEVGSDEWNGDGRGPSNPPPGGVEANNGILTIEDAVTTGSGENNNRKIYFIHSITQEGITAQNLLDSGVTITFRARLTPPDGKNEIPLPNGYGIFSSGKGMFGVRQSNPSSIISFSLVLQNEDGDASNSLAFQSAGLTMNRNNGDTPNSTGTILQGVNSSNDPNLNPIVPLDPTEWHEFWITIQANDATPGNGTHTVTVYVDGSTSGYVFNVTAGTGSDTDTTITPNWTDYIAMGLNNSPTVGAFDVDFFGYKPGIWSPVPLTPPSPPSNVTVMSGDKQVRLTWNPSPQAEGYFVKRSQTSGGPYSVIIPVATTNYTDTDVINGQLYYYVITATNAAGESANSIEVIGRPSASITGVQAVNSASGITVTWNQFNGAVSYSVHRATVSGGPYTQIASGITETTYLDTNVQPGTRYYYVVYGELGSGEQTGISNEAMATTPPSAPTLSCSLYAATAIALAWTIPGQVITEFVIERSTDGINFTQIATAPPNYKGYTNINLSPNTLYYYRVKAQNGGGASEYSQIVSQKTPTIGVNVNFANTAAPVPIGYLQDTGLPLGDRGNGYYYGWTSPVGRDLTQDTRYRQNANSPDLRYDTFNHLMKANTSDPSVGAIWEIELPPGFYYVRIVAGDPTATDSVFEFDVEGYLTESYVPVSGAWWGDFNLVVPLTDGLLTVKSGPNARNNKINFIDIYATVPEMVNIVKNPEPVTVLESRPFKLTVEISGGTKPVWCQWYKDGVPIPNAISTTFTVNRAILENSGDYFAVITNFAGAVTSSIVHVEVLADSEPPKLLSAASLDGNVVFVKFNEPLDVLTASDAVNYNIESDGIAIGIISAVLLTNDDSMVMLTLDPLTPITGASFNLTVSGVDDLSSADNSIPYEAPEVCTGTVAHLTALDIGLPGTGGFSATGPTLNMALPGFTLNYSNGVYDVYANGWDIWNTVDGFHFVYREFTGNFDAVVRVQSMTRPDPWAKAGLMIRPTTNANSRFVAVYATPTNGQNNITVQWRDTDGAGCGSVHGGSGGPAISPPFPNCWLRLQRDGAVINGYWSTNGIDWVLYASRDTAQYGGPYPDTVYVGMAATSHNQSALTNYVFVEFRDFSVQAPPPVAVTLLSPQIRDGTFSVKVQSVSGKNYILEATDSLTAPNWQEVGPPVAGTGQEITLTDPSASAPAKFYRVKVQ